MSWKNWFKAEDNRPLHEKYPNILEWRKGDCFEAVDFVLDWCDTNRYNLISVTSEGIVYAQYYDGQAKFNLKDFYKHFRNNSLRDRRISKEIKNSKEYMMLLSDFQKSVEELQRRDVQEIGAPIEDYLDNKYRESLG